MNKLLVFIGSIVALLVTAFTVTSFVARRAERQLDATLQRLAGSGSPVPAAQVDDKNDLALALESLADPLGVELRPRERGRRAAATSEIDRRLVRSMADWLRAQEENPTDAIAPLPPGVRKWLDAHRNDIDAVANALVEQGVPRWPVEEIGSSFDRPIPNLSGHMHLYRILNVASLDRELQGDHAGAWHLQHAAWNLTRGLLDRTETISMLIAIAGVRMEAAAQRKLEAPVPAWVADMPRRRMHHEMLEAIRAETSLTSKMVRSGGWLSDLTAGLRHQPNRALLAYEAVSSPLVRWSVAENATAAMEGLAAMQNIDPCAATTRRFDREMEQEVSPLARRFGRFVLPNLTNAIGRGALADMAIEGTSKVLAVKTARAATSDRAWPAAVRGVESSRCEGARWVYSVDPSGAMSLRFDGTVHTPPGFPGSKIPLEYREPATPAS
jgi:hypothetical protein